MCLLFVLLRKQFVLGRSASVEGAENIEPGREAPGSLQRTFKVGEPVFLSGVAMNGRTPLLRVEYWVRSVGTDAPSTLADDADELLTAPWEEATIQPPPIDWTAALPNGTDPTEVFGFAANGQPSTWPLPMSYVGWSVTLTALAEGEYELRARTVDVNGNAQPQPRPVQKSGRNSIGCRRITVVA
jgi:hypothetical protein